MGDYGDDDNCEGISGVEVELTGADGKIVTLHANGVGNFFYEGPLAKPYKARVRANGGRGRQSVRPAQELRMR